MNLSSPEDIIEEDNDDQMDISQESLDEPRAETSRTTEKRQDKRIEQILTKLVAQCVLASSTKRGFCRDADIAEVFTDRKERDLKESVLKKVKKQLADVLGIRMEYDNEGKRHYIFNDLKQSIGNDLAEVLSFSLEN